MPDRYPHFWGGSQICTQGAPLVKATNGEKLKMLNCKSTWISDPAANTMQTPVIIKLMKKNQHFSPFYEKKKSLKALFNLNVTNALKNIANSKSGIT